MSETIDAWTCETVCNDSAFYVCPWTDVGSTSKLSYRGPTHHFTVPKCVHVRCLDASRSARDLVWACALRNCDVVFCFASIIAVIAVIALTYGWQYFGMLYALIANLHAHNVSKYSPVLFLVKGNAIYKLQCKLWESGVIASDPVINDQVLRLCRQSTVNTRLWMVASKSTDSAEMS